MGRLDFNVDPLWQFLGEQYGFIEAFSFFGPYVGARVTPSQPDDYTIEVTMPLVPQNTNYVGTHFGGSLYSMCDPWYMFILMRNLGKDYIVWDKTASIDFVKPGTGTVKAVFHIDQQEIDTVKEIVAREKKTVREYQTQIIDEDGSVVANLTKGLYIRRVLKKNISKE